MSVRESIEAMITTKRYIWRKQYQKWSNVSNCEV